jgi:hypothetical protein
MKKLLFFLLFINSFFSNAQNAPTDQIIEVDKFTGLVNMEFPFDRSFYIKMKVDKDDNISTISFTRVYGSGRDLENNYGTILKKLNFREEPIEGDTKKKFLIIQMPPLAPNGLYDILIKRRLSGKSLLALFETDSLLFYDNVGVEFSGVKAIESLFSKNSKNDSLINTEKHVMFINSLAKVDHGSCTTFLAGSLSEQICSSDAKTHNYIKFYSKILAYTWESNPISPPYNLSAYKDIFDSIQKPLYDNLFLSEVVSSDLTELNAKTKYKNLINVISNLQVSSQDLTIYQGSLNSLVRLMSLNNNAVLWLNGRASLSDELNIKMLKHFDFEGRIKNISTNIRLLNKTISELYLLGYSNSLIANDANDVIIEIQNLVTKLEAIKKNMNSIIQTIHKLENFATKEFILTNTYFSKVSTEAGKWVLPDFGVVFAPSNKSNNILRPFLGANINFGPVDKDIKTRFMSDSIAPGSSKVGRYVRNHFSMLLGVSIGTIKEEGVREDLLNGINIMTGLSYRVGHVVRVSGGALWFNGVDPNPTISDKKIKALGYISISFDIDFKNASGSTLNKLF